MCATAASTSSIGTHRLLSKRHRVPAPRPAGRRRGAALRRAAQGVDQEAQGRRRRAHAVGHADSAHARDEPDGYPRPQRVAHAAGRTPADPHLRRRVRRARRVRGAAPRAAARGPGLLRAQPRRRHRGQGAGPARARARSAHRHRARADGRRLAREGGARLRRRAIRRARVHHHHRERHRHAGGQHARGRPRRHARARSAAPDPRPRRVAPGCARTRTCSSRPTGR